MSSFSSNIHPIMEENEAFLKSEAGIALTESTELVNDAIDYAYILGKKDNPEKLSVERAFYFYVHHVLMPTSYSIAINLLVGNLPSCFRDLRFLIEFLAKAYLADARYAENEFFRDRLDALHKEKTAGGKRHKRELDFVGEFDEIMNFGGKVIGQWRKFSNEVHASKYMERIVNNIVEKDNMPGHSLVFPVPYTKKDLPELIELGKDIEEFATILKSTFNHY